MTDAEKVEALQSAIRRADRVLDWILADGGHAEWMLTTAKRVRRILQAALKKTTDGAQAAAGASTCTDEAGSASLAGETVPPQKITLPKVKLGRRAIGNMKQDGILKERKRK